MTKARTHSALPLAVLLTMACFANGAKAADQYETNGVPSGTARQDEGKQASDPVPLAKKDGETNLTETLKRNEGVLRPPEGNAAPMAIEPPNGATGRMPVIPPPGSPGGDQSIRPK